MRPLLYTSEGGALVERQKHDYSKGHYVTGVAPPMQSCLMAHQIGSFELRPLPSGWELLT